MFWLRWEHSVLFKGHVTEFGVFLQSTQIVTGCRGGPKPLPTGDNVTYYKLQQLLSGKKTQ